MRTSSRGFSVTEAAIILTVFSILSGLAAPAVNDYVERAKLLRAQHDVTTIGISLLRLFDDVGPVRATNRWTDYDLLVGAGQPPRSSHAGANAWAQSGEEAVGMLDDHLVTNAAGYETDAMVPGQGWRGTYLQDRVGADPWGARYAVNIAAMRQEFQDTVALSAGPDSGVDTPFAFDGFATRGDDITAVVATNGNAR